MAKKYKANCPKCGKENISSFDDAPVLTKSCECGYMILEDEVDWEECEGKEED